MDFDCLYKVVKISMFFSIYLPLFILHSKKNYVIILL